MEKCSNASFTRPLLSCIHPQSPHEISAGCALLFVPATPFSKEVSIHVNADLPPPPRGVNSPPSFIRLIQIAGGERSEFWNPA